MKNRTKGILIIATASVLAAGAIISRFGWGTAMEILLVLAAAIYLSLAVDLIFKRD